MFYYIVQCNDKNLPLSRSICRLRSLSLPRLFLVPFLSVCLSLPLNLSARLSISFLSLSIYLCPSVSLSLAPPVSLSISVCFHLPLFHSFFLSPSLRLSRSVHLALSVTHLHLSLFACLFRRLSLSFTPSLIPGVCQSLRLFLLLTVSPSVRPSLSLSRSFCLSPSVSLSLCRCVSLLLHLSGL